MSPSVKSVYSVAQLARLAGISTRRMARLLKRVGLLEGPAEPGLSPTISVTQLRRAWPDLWDSIVYVQSVAEDDEA